jgi:hypothetical protein
VAEACGFGADLKKPDESKRDHPKFKRGHLHEKPMEGVAKFWDSAKRGVDIRKGPMQRQEYEQYGLAVVKSELEGALQKQILLMHATKKRVGATAWAKNMKGDPGYDRILRSVVHNRGQSSFCRGGGQAGALGFCPGPGAPVAMQNLELRAVYTPSTPSRVWHRPLYSPACSVAFSLNFSNRFSSDWTAAARAGSRTKESPSTYLAFFAA